MNWEEVIKRIKERKQSGDMQFVRVNIDERTVQFDSLWKKAVELWGSEEAAMEWLTSPEISLGGITPLDYSRTDVGACKVEKLMGQIAYGIST
jgi:putative toxin-antitoxin system antitoxin component (TIGR02293 family)